MFKIFPYDLYEGRWYKFFLESKDDEIKLTTSDIPSVELSGQYLKFPVGFHVVSVMTDFNSVPAETVQNRIIDIRFETDGRQSVFLPNAKNFDYGSLYVLGYDR